MHYHRGLAHEAKDKPDLAIAEYCEALRLQPDLTAARLALGNLCSLLGRSSRVQVTIDEAAAQFREVLRLHPDNALAHRSLGELFHDQDEFESAAAEFREAIRLNPDDAAAHHGLGKTLSSRDEFDAAIAEYHEALRLQPDLGEAHVSLGYLYHTLRFALDDKGKLDVAATEFREAIRIAPDNTFTHEALAYVYRNQRKYVSAIAESYEALMLDPVKPGCIVILLVALVVAAEMAKHFLGLNLRVSLEIPIAVLFAVFAILDSLRDMRCLLRDLRKEQSWRGRARRLRKPALVILACMLAPALIIAALKWWHALTHEHIIRSVGK